ncbi:DUF1906 domain-containing protein [Streptomyces sp. R33]|uniref:DUF1906 domain-containing protein n=2 Tax=Streptomyces sp. R33 TaxID=3238629 RepID=A0AB39XV84_9ACTN
MSEHRRSRRARILIWMAAGLTLAATTAVSANALTFRGAVVGRGLLTPSLYAGRVFDTCTAPSLTAMKAWRSDQFYGGAAVYIGGKNRGCAQPQLTASWVKSVDAAGWKLVPLYVGAQPPCQTGSNPERFTTADAAAVGTANGSDAVAKASALGMKPGSALYLDMEPFNLSDAPCLDAVLTYVRAWDKAVRTQRYWPGMYGFTSSSAAAVANASDRRDLPAILWYALWDKNETTTDDWRWDPNLYTGHRRAHQYAANSTETRGGVTLTVDRSTWDAPVAIIAK